MKKILAIILAAMMLVSVFALASCGDAKDAADTNNNANETADGTNDGAAAPKEKLIMATNASFPPYEFYENEVIVGIDAEIAAAIAEKLGMELEIQDMEFGSILGAVQSGKVHMGMAGMTVTDERKQSVNFSDTYATGVQVVIVKENSDIKDLDSITGKKIGVQQDTTGDIYASDTPENGGYGEDAVVRFKTGNDAVAALVAGKGDCVIIDNEPAKSYVASNEGLAILETQFAVEDYAIALSKDNADLLGKINTALSELKADGTIANIVEKYIPTK